jgi:two-component system chemotaxis sensor kinase CheA
MEDDDIIREFLIESNENLNRLDAEIVDLERQPTAERLASIFRTIHTIKGTCGFLGFPILERITHHAENILSQLRSGQRQVTGGVVSVILESVDAVRKILTNIESSGAEGEDAYSEITERLAAVASSGADIPEKIKDAEATQPDPVANVPTPASAPEPEKTASVTPATPEASAVAARAATSPAAAPDVEKSSSVVDTSIRVDVSLLDKLMNLVGELVLARNQILQFNGQREDVQLNATSQRLNLITTELQESVMKTRMQPIGVVWNKLPRIVRDVAHSLGKQIELEMEGAETELDKTIIEAIKDPLTHIVRNSCDHGIEDAETRIRARKSPGGRLRLKAYHEGGQVNIEISDDGAGVNVERVKQKAIEKGLIRPEQASQMTEREAISLLFMPGFSTAAKITNVSGRGVGMDVVKSNVEKIGGSVEIASRFGSGTTVKLKIPLTLAIIPGLVINSAGHVFIVPQVSLLEVIRLEGEAMKRIEYVHDTPVYRRRGSLLPIVYLNELLRLPAGEQPEALNVVVLQAEDRQFGLIVDGVNDTQEIVVKPLGKQLKELTCYSGSTVMGDGSIALILDVLGLGQLSGVLSNSREESRLGQQQTAQTVTDTQRLLLFKSGSFERLAVPLSVVARLEEIPRSSVELAGGKQVVQYRDQILPLISLSEVLEPGRLPELEDDPIQVVVFSNEDRTIGMVVDKIIDIVEDTVTNRRPASLRKGLLGSGVVAKLVVDFLDVQNVVQDTGEEFFSSTTVAQSSTLLLADSSPFARGLLRSQLEMAGYRVVEASNIQELMLHIERASVQLVLASGGLLSSDVNSIEKVRKAASAAGIPILALSNTAAEMALWKSHFPDFDDHQIRFERESMLRSIERLSRSLEDSEVSVPLAS